MNEILEDILIVGAVLVAGGVLASPRVANTKEWRATITPLASIIGSGFLILGPILDASFGKWAPAAMAALCILGYAFGSAIRFNIKVLDGAQAKGGPHEKWAERASSWALAFAYFVSVAYYLNLFGAFGVSLTEVDDRLHARLLTSAAFLVILFVGWFRGFGALERMEQISVSVKLSIILGLIVGLAIYFFNAAGGGELVFNAPSVTGHSAVTLLFGLIVTVQGFETSRYLGEEYSAKMRIASMHWAQWVSSGIYIIYILLMAYVFKRGELKLEETAIIGMMDIVAPILPALLVVAALSAQFSAAVADTSGSGGLLNELTKGKVDPKRGYAALVAVGLGFTWFTNVFEIINYASRAFAFYYALQSALAAMRSHRTRAGIGLTALYGSLALLGALIVVFGKSVEGGGPPGG